MPGRREQLGVKKKSQILQENHLPYFFQDVKDVEGGTWVDDPDVVFPSNEEGEEPVTDGDPEGVAYSGTPGEYAIRALPGLDDDRDPARGGTYSDPPGEYAIWELLGIDDMDPEGGCCPDW